MPVLEELFLLHADAGTRIDVGAAPHGRRVIVDITGGYVNGPRLRGRVLPSGADWLQVGADGVGRLDVRALVETDDGARIYVHYTGVIVIDDAVAAALAGGGGMEFGDTYFMTSPRFETGHPDYAWLNALVAVGQGRLVPDGVEYRVFAVQND
jgi:hypothetical protein